MRKLIFLVSFIMVSTYSFADIQSLNLTNPKQLQTLTSAWKSKHTVDTKPLTNDMTIVYGGADILHKQVLTTHNFTV